MTDHMLTDESAHELAELVVSGLETPLRMFVSHANIAAAANPRDVEKMEEVAKEALISMLTDVSFVVTNIINSMSHAWRGTPEEPEEEMIHFANSFAQDLVELSTQRVTALVKSVEDAFESWMRSGNED